MLQIKTVKYCICFCFKDVFGSWIGNGLNMDNNEKQKCFKCAKEFSVNAKFCPYCGESANTEVSSGVETEFRKKKKPYWILVALVILIAAGGLFGGKVYLDQQNAAKEAAQKQEKYAETLDTANRYFQEMKYKEAEDSYLAALEIDPKSRRPYTALYEIYLMNKEADKAEEILKKAKEALPSEEAKLMEEETGKFKKEYEYSQNNRSLSSEEATALVDINEQELEVVLMSCISY